MSDINNTIAKLEFAQIGWVVPDIHAAVKFLSGALGVAGFPEPEHVSAQDLNMSYYGKVVPGEWLTTQTYNGNTFIDSFSRFPGKVCSMTIWPGFPWAAHNILHSVCRLTVLKK